MIRKVTLLAGLVASAAVFGAGIKIPVKPYESRLDDPAYRTLLERSATTHTGINTFAREYLSAKAIDVPETLRVLAIRVEFPEDDDPATWGDGKMDLEGYGSPSEGLFYDPPHDRTYFMNQMEGLRNFYLLNSRGRLVIEYDVYPSDPFKCYQVPQKMPYYGDTSNLDRGLTLFMRDALLAASNDLEIDFSKYHYIYNGQTFDMVVIFHAGSTNQASYWYGYTSDLASATITPGALEAYTGLPYVEAGGVQISTASILPESPRVEGVMSGLPGILYHEFAHLLGAYDLYDVTSYTQGVGAWALMGGGGWLGYPSGQIPSMHDAFTRNLFGWEDPIIVNSDTTISLYSTEFDTLAISSWEADQRPTLALVPIRWDDAGSPQEYFLIENRQTDVKAKDTIEVEVEGGVPIWVVEGEYDSYQPGSGIIIWHIDEDLIDEWGDYNYVNVWTAYGEHNAVDMEEADGIQDYELLWYQSTGSYASQGSKFDPFFAGANDEFGPETNPSSDGYYGETGVTIKVLGEPDTVMRVEITFDAKLSGFPKRSTWVDEYKSVFALDLDDDGSKELLALGARSSNSSYGEAWTKDGSPYGTSPYINTFFDSLVAPAALGDVDGDGKEEIVLAGYNGNVAVFDSLMNDHPSMISYSLDGRILAAPMLADLDGDDDLEILEVDEFGGVYALDVGPDSVAVLSGFPVDVGEEVRSGFALFDVGSPRFAMLASSGRLYLFDSKGKIEKGFPLELGKGSAQNDVPPIIVDIDGDGEREIVTFVYDYDYYRYTVVSQDGSVKYRSSRNFPAPLTTPALADVDKDGLAEVLFGSGNGFWALDANGSTVPGYPVVFPETYDVQGTIVHGGYVYFVTFQDPFFFPSSPVLADIDGDDEVEIVIGSPNHGVYLIEPGAREPYKTLYTREGIGKALSVFDLDGDGKLEIVASTVDTFKSNIHVWKTKGSEVAWGQWMHDPTNSGLSSESSTAPAPPSSPLAEVYAYPNPARYHAYLHVLVGDVDALKIQLIDISGKLIGTIEPSFNPEMVNDILLDELLADAAAGLYIIRVEAAKEGERTVELYKLGVIR